MLGENGVATRLRGREFRASGRIAMAQPSGGGGGVFADNSRHAKEA